jgi:hypothetical protein
LRLGGGGGRGAGGVFFAVFCGRGVCCCDGGVGKVEVGVKCSVLSVVYSRVFRLEFDILNKVVIVLWSSESSCL